MPITTDTSINPYAYSNSITNSQVSESRAADNMRSERSEEQKAADNAIIASMSTQIIESNMQTQNAQSGISLLQTADGASESISQNLQRMNELALQAQNGTLTSAQREVLNVEYQQNLQSLNDMANETQFNEQTLLNAENSRVNVAASSDSSTTITLPDLTSAGLSIEATNISNAEEAAAAAENITAALESVSTARAQFGADQNGLIANAEAAMSAVENTTQARSQIQDQDYAQQVSDQVRQRVLDDAQTMMQAQANQNRSAVLQVLDTGN